MINGCTYCTFSAFSPTQRSVPAASHTEQVKELGGKTARFAEGSPHFGCKLNVSESWVGGSSEYQHAVTWTAGRRFKLV